MSQPELTEEELKALEAEMEKVTVSDVLVQTIVTLLNLGARRAGLAAKPDQESEDASSAPSADGLEQLRLAIEGARALLPLVEERYGDKLAPIRDGLSQLQLIYARHAKESSKTSEPSDASAEKSGAPTASTSQPAAGPAQRSGRLWVPGQ